MRTIASVALALTLVTPSVQAASPKVQPSVHYVIEAMSNNCQYRLEADCVNVAVSIEADSGTEDVQWCVSTQDNRMPSPPAAAGCVESDEIAVGFWGVDVPDLDVPSVLATDCPPGEACATESVNVRASASFVTVGEGVHSTSRVHSVAGRCRTRTVTQFVRFDLVGTVTVDGFSYELPGSDPLAHHRSATLVQETTLVTSSCR